MKRPILSLANLKAAHAALFGNSDTDQKEGKKSEEGSEGTTDEESEGEGSDDEGESDSEEEADKKDGQEGEKADDKKDSSADTQPKGVHLSTEDFKVVTELASEAVSLREENKGLKAKADQWDSYQAALNGVKPVVDSAGANGKEEKSESTDPHADLRSKHPNLMKDL